MIATLTGREPHPAIPLLTPEVEEQCRSKGKAELIDIYYKTRAQALILSKHDPLRHGMELPIWKKADEQVEELRKLFPHGVTHLVNLGANRCLVKGSLIYDPVFGTFVPIENLNITTNVLAWNGKAWEVAYAHPSFSRGVLDCVEVRTADGQSFRCAKSHRMLTQSGWKEAGFLTEYDELCHCPFAPFPPASSSGTSLSGSSEDDLRLSGTIQDFPSGYQSHFRFGGARLRSVQDNGRDVLPSQADVPGHSTVFGSIARWLVRHGAGSRRYKSDDQGKRFRYSQFLSQRESRLSTLDVLNRLADLGAGIESHFSDTSLLSACATHEDRAFAGVRQQSSPESFLPRSISESDPLDNLFDCELPCGTITTHVAGVKPIGIQECFDFHVPRFENYMHAGVCHHNSAKTTRAARRVTKLAVTKPGARIWCLHSTEAASRADQQPLIFDCLPPEWRPDSGKMRPKGNRTTKIVYSDSGGFTNNHLILPNGSQIWFKFYGANVKTLEGAEIDMAWADELIEPDWIEALRFRLVNRNGHLLLTFTPVEGYSATVRMYLENAVTLEETDAELLPIFDESGNTVAHQKVPRVQQSGIPQARIVYFHTIDNPFGNYEGMKVEARGSNEERIKMRVYGVPTKSSSSQFNFNSAVHVITENEFAEWVKKYPDGTRYHLVDPCSGRNWFMGWAFCPRPDTVIWYREWPSHGHPKAYIEGIGDPGPWATLVTTKARREGTKAPEDGEKGPAQEPFKFSLRRYRDEIIKAEEGELIFERWMDSRYGNSPKDEVEESTTLIQQMDSLGMQFCAMSGENQILNRQKNDGSVDFINSALYYDKTKPIGAYSDELARINQPNMMVVETCPNIMFSLEIWTGKDKGEGASKDPVDVIRGFFLSQLGYVGPQSMRVRGGSSGY